MPRTGFVLETSSQTAKISTSRRGICDGCKDKSACSIESAYEKAQSEIVTAINSISAKPGDQVEFDLSGHTELKVSLIVWGIPLIGLIFGALLGTRIHNILSVSSDTGTLIGAGFGFLITFLAIMFYDRYIINQKHLVPFIKKIVTDNQCELKVD